MTTPITSIYVINLDHRTDRWIQFQEVWKDILDFDKVKRISAISGMSLPGVMQRPWFTRRTLGKAKTWAGVAGCVMSHKKALETALKSDDEVIVIFEDDAIPSPFVDKLALKLYFEKTVAEPAIPWDVCYCGYSKLLAASPAVPPSVPFISHPIKGALCACAYLLTREGILSVLPHLPAEQDVWAWIARFRAIDTWYYFHLHSVLKRPLQALFPPVVVQSDSFSDIVQKETHYFSTSNSFNANPLNGIKLVSPGYARLAPLQKTFRTTVEWTKFFRSRLLGLPGLKKQSALEPSATTNHIPLS